jgi:hypothetical protein
MAEMPRLAKSFCTSWVYRAFAQKLLLPWAVGDARLTGTALEIGAGSGAMAAQLLARFPDRHGSSPAAFRRVLVP